MCAETCHKLRACLPSKCKVEAEVLYWKLVREYNDGIKDKPLPLDNTLLQSLVAVHNVRRAVNRRV